MAIVTTDNAHYTNIAAAIRTKNGQTKQYKPSEMATAISELSIGNYWVRIIDYDGTLLAEKRLNDGKEFELPEPPTHERLTFQGWSSSAPIVDGVVTVDKNNIMVGAVYKTASGATEIDIVQTAVTGLTFPLKFYKSDTAAMVVDWDDGSVDDVIGTGSKSLSHAYAAVGDYTIKIITDGAYYFNTYVSNNTTSVINYTIKRVFLSDKVTSISTNAFNGCYSLSQVVMPQGVTSIGTNAFNGCYAVIEYNFSACTYVPVLANTSAFSNINGVCKILVPLALESAWKTATNWATYANYIVGV